VVKPGFKRKVSKIIVHTIQNLTMDIKLKLDTCYITLNLDILDETSYFERDVKYITRNTFE